MVATVTVAQVPIMYFSGRPANRRLSDGIDQTTIRTVGVGLFTVVRASQSQNEEIISNTKNPLGPPPPGFISQEDWKYLGKLGAGSLVGAAAIKYGSIFFPEITRPNLLQALIMIFGPVFVAVVLLFIKQSRTAD